MNKISKFTKAACNEKDELLLYNSYIGEYSFCKLVDKKYITEFLKGDVNSFPDYLKSILKEKGIIVPDNRDENKLLDIQYYRIVSPHILRLTINPTESCNFACKYCYENHVSNKMSEKTQKDILRFAGSNIQKYTGLHVSWFGGEPLIHRESLSYLSNSLMKMCQFYKRKYSADMTTNAYLLDYDTFNEMVDYNIKNFQITVDGTESLHNSQRFLKNGDGTYRQIMKNLSEIKESKRNDFKITIRVNFTQKLYNVFEEFYESIENFIYDNRFYISFHTVKNIEETVAEDLKEDILDNRKNPMELIYKLICSKPEGLNLRRDMLNPGMGLCYGGKNNNFVIKSDGSVFKCTVDFEDRNNQVGRLNNGTMELFDKCYDYITNRHKCQGYYSCFFAPVCTGDPCPKKDKNQIRCPFLKENIDIILCILDKYRKFDIVDGGIG